MQNTLLALRLQAAADHFRRGERDAAERVLEEILVNAPRHADALEWTGFLALESGRFDRAVDRLSQAIRCGNNKATTYLLLGRAHKGAGDLDAGIASYRRAVLKDARLVDAHVSLGIALRAKGDVKEAARSYRTALALAPTSFEAHLNLGNLEIANGNFAEAAARYESAERLRPVSAETHLKHGNALWRLGRKSEATVQLQRAIAGDPDLLEAYETLGDLLSEMSQHEAALKFRQELLTRLDSGAGHPTDAAARASMRSNAVLGVIGALMGASRYDDALATTEAEIRVTGDTLGLLHHLYWIAPYRFTSQADFVDLYHRHHGLRELADVKQLPASLPTAEPQRLRIGYSSGDFRDHSVAYFLEPLLACHDRTRFTVVCYSSTPTADDVTARLKSHADEWVDAKDLSNLDFARRVAADKIDVLVDLSGRTEGSRPGAFALRPAFVQVTYLGYPTFTGFKELDFRITDSVIDRDGEDATLTSELPLRLPRSMFCYRPPADMPEPAWSPATDGVVRFGSFNQAPKLGPETLRAWAAILERVPRSVLVLKSFAFKNEATRRRVLDTFASLGIPGARLDVRPPDEEKRHHFAAYRSIDVALDTFPYNGATTTCEALWMGVPVVTFAGETHAQRTGASLLGALGLDDLVAHSVEDYVSVAVNLAANETRRAQLRAGLRQRFAESPLRDEPGFTRSFEALLQQAWRARFTAQCQRAASESNGGAQ